MVYKYYKGFYILYLVDLFKKKNTFRVPATFSPLLSTGNTTVNETDILFLYIWTNGRGEIIKTDEGKSSQNKAMEHEHHKEQCTFQNSRSISVTLLTRFLGKLV